MQWDLLGIMPLPPISEKSVQSATTNEFLDFVLELNAFLHVVAMIVMVEAILVWITPLRLHPQPFCLEQLPLT